jgi:hypothetical protein
MARRRLAGNPRNDRSRTRERPAGSGCVQTPEGCTMILMYTSLLFVLGVAKLLIGRRVKSLEKKYARVAKQADALVKQPSYRDGNSNRVDPYATAKRQYLLGLLAQKRDRVEAKYAAWQVFSEKYGRFVGRVQNWKGRKLPYTFGAVDVACLLGAIDYLGFSEIVGVRALVHYVTGLFTG